MASPSERALEAVQKLKDSGIDAKDIRSAVRLLGGGDFDSIYSQLIDNQEHGKREKEIIPILRGLKYDLKQQLKFLTNEIDSSTQEILLEYVPDS